MSTKSRTLPLVCALVTLFASHAGAQDRMREYTFVYEATVTSAEVGAPASVGEKMRITFTFDSSVYSPVLYGYYQYPLVAATGSVGTKSWSFDHGSIYVTDNEVGAPGILWDAYTVVLGSAPYGVTPVQFVLKFYSEGTTSLPPQGLTHGGQQIIPPNPSAFQSASLTVESWKYLSAIVSDYISATADAAIVVVPTCVVQQNLKMTGRALAVEYRLSSTEFGTLNLFFTSDSATRRLFSIPIGPLVETPLNLPIPDLPIFGVVGVMTTITTPKRGIVCWDYDIIDAGPPSP